MCSRPTRYERRQELIRPGKSEAGRETRLLLEKKDIWLEDGVYVIFFNIIVSHKQKWGVGETVEELFEETETLENEA